MNVSAVLFERSQIKCFHASLQLIIQGDTVFLFDFCFAKRCGLHTDFLRQLPLTERVVMKSSLAELLPAFSEKVSRDLLMQRKYKIISEIFKFFLHHLLLFFPDVV